MCMAIPSRIVELAGEMATVEAFGELRSVSLMLMSDGVALGDYVLVHAGYAIQVLDEKEALETLSLWNEILAAEPQKQTTP